MKPSSTLPSPLPSTCVLLYRTTPREMLCTVVAHVLSPSALVPRGVSRAIAIGNFDGVHRGHRRLVEDMVAAARAQGLEAAVLTFSPHPARVLAADRAPPLLLPEPRRYELLFELGVDRVVVQPFDLAVAAMSPHDFAASLLRDALGAKVVCVGYDFSFGAGRAGTTGILSLLGSELGFATTVTPAVRVRGVICASSAIRSYLGTGQIDEAAALLGRAPELEGRVVHGAGRGRTIGVPTANLVLDGEVRPALGVYAAWAELEDGRRVRAAVNVGTNPTFTDEKAVHVEAHLLDFAGDVYGTRIRLHLLRWLRSEQRFAGKDALVAQIRADIEATRNAEAAPLPPVDTD